MTPVTRITQSLPRAPVALLLDYDGVIVESVKLKVDAFLQIYADEEPAKLAAVLEHQHAHGGVTRRVKFRHCETEIFGRAVDDARVEELSRAYTTLVHDAVLACPFVPGAVEFLQRVSGQAAMHVISGTPQDELADIVERRGLARYFASLHGAPTTKPEAFAAIVKEGAYDVRRLVAIGDATTEYDAAKDLGIAFLGLIPVGESSPFPPGVRTVVSLVGVADMLGFA